MGIKRPRKVEAIAIRPNRKLQTFLKFLFLEFLVATN